jgi:integrase
VAGNASALASVNTTLPLIFNTPLKIDNILRELHNNGRTETFVEMVNDRLMHISRNADLNNPDTVKAFIANKKASNNYKRLLVESYDYYCKHYKIEWTRPTYEREEKMPKLPTEEQLNKLIAAAKGTLSLKLWISKETGMRPVEILNLLVRDIDTEHNAIIPTTAKHGCGRALTIQPNLTKAIQTHIIKNDLDINDKVFTGTAKTYGDNYQRMRNGLAKKLNDPNLKTVRLYDFRHWFATMRYWKYRDVGLTATDMGHKNWNTTRKYVHLTKILEMIKEDEWDCKTADTVEKAKELLEHGFDYITEMDGLKLFRKRK